MKKTKTQKGITLIALIITIIILLILAVVTIGPIKNSNIITYAQNAADDYNREKQKESGILGDYEYLIEDSIENNKISSTDFKKFVISTLNSMEKNVEGKYYNLNVLRNEVKEKYPTAFAEVNAAGTALGGLSNYSSEEEFESTIINLVQDEYIHTLNILFNYEKDLFYVNVNGEIIDYNGSAVPMKETEAQKLFEYRAPTSSEIEKPETNGVVITSYLGTDTTVRIPTVLYDEETGNVTKIIQGIGSEAFRKSDTVYTKKAIWDLNIGIASEADYRNKTINELFGGNYQGSVDGNLATLEAKKTAVIESFIVPQNIPEYAYEFDEELIPYFWVADDGSLMYEKPLSDIKEVYIPLSVRYIGTYAFANQTSLTTVYAGLSNIPTIESNAFNNCTLLKDIYIRLTKTDLEKITGLDTKWGAPSSTVIHYVEDYFVNAMSEYDTTKFKALS